MKHFFALSLFASLLSMAAQNPNYDPDSNGDDLIGAEDLVSLLGVYNTSLAVDTTLECDFDGTAEDEWLFGILSGEIILDSVVVQYSISDSATYFEPGCPTEQVYYLDVEMEYTLFQSQINESSMSLYGNYPNPWGGTNNAIFQAFFDSNYGRAYWQWLDYALGVLRNSSAPYGADFHFKCESSSIYSCINSSAFTRTFTLSENGLVGEVRCNGEVVDSGPWNDPEYNYFRILPYWHYAE